MDPLWGKSKKSGVTLYQHTLAVVEAGDALFGTADKPTRLGECWLRFFKLPPDTWKQFYWNLLAAELLHDWGKANDGMQRVLTGTGDQAIRHEHFSAILIAQPPCWDWLGKRPELDREVVLSAVLTHHLKAREEADKRYGFATAENSHERFRSLHQSVDFESLLTFAAERLGCRDKPDLSRIPECWTFEGPTTCVASERRRIKTKILKPFDTAIHPDQRNEITRRRLLAAVRAALISADAAGSGYVREGYAVKAEVWRQFAEGEL